MGKFIVAGFAAFWLIIGGVFVTSGYYNDRTATCTIEGKNRNVAYDKDGNREVQMLIYTEDCGVFEVSDSLVKGTFRSADLYGSLKEGSRYELKYHGWRNGFLSMFPTITRASEVS